MTIKASTPTKSGLNCAAETRLQYCKSFLQVYVETSIRQRVVLDDREDSALVEPALLASDAEDSVYQAGVPTVTMTTLMGRMELHDGYRDLNDWLFNN